MAHNSWLHIARFNLTYCQNPLHRYHRVPEIPELHSDIDLMLLAAKYANKSITVVSDKFAINSDIDSRALLLKELNALNDSIRGEDEPT